MQAMREEVTLSSETVVQVFSRVVINGQLYYSHAISKVEKRTSFTDNIIKVYSYVIVEEEETKKCFALCDNMTQYDV